MNEPNHQKTNGSFEDSLFALAFDCTSMVSRLSRVLELAYEDDHKAALAQLVEVEEQIEVWIRRLQGLETTRLDKEGLLTNLKQAKEMVEVDDQS